MELSADQFAAGVGLLNTAYNLYTNKRDFDYQKALQQTMFEREDTAVQRRMADLQAAGLNPNLAAGSAANAGSVVSRSSTNDVNMGSALDMLQAVNNIRQQKQQVENAKVENQILNIEKVIKDTNKIVNEMSILHNLGFNVQPFMDTEGNHLGYKYFGNGNRYRIPENINKLFENLDYEHMSNKNSASILEKENESYSADKIASYLSTLFKILK